MLSPIDLKPIALEPDELVTLAVSAKMRYLRRYCVGCQDMIAARNISYIHRQDLTCYTQLDLKMDFPKRRYKHYSEKL